MLSKFSVKKAYTVMVGNYSGRGIFEQDEHRFAAQYEPALCDCDHHVHRRQPGTGREYGDAAD